METLVPRGTNMWPYIGDVQAEFQVQRVTDNEHGSWRLETSIAFIGFLHVSCISEIGDILWSSDEFQVQRWNL